MLCDTRDFIKVGMRASVSFRISNPEPFPISIKTMKSTAEASTQKRIQAQAKCQSSLKEIEAKAEATSKRRNTNF